MKEIAINVKELVLKIDGVRVLLEIVTKEARKVNRKETEQGVSMKTSPHYILISSPAVIGFPLDR